MTHTLKQQVTALIAKRMAKGYTEPEAIRRVFDSSLSCTIARVVVEIAKDKCLLELAKEMDGDLRTY